MRNENDALEAVINKYSDKLYKMCGMYCRRLSLPIT